MQTIQHSLDEWLRKEAHIMVGHSFRTADCTCVPVAPEIGQALDTPIGFLLTHGADIAFVEVHTPEGMQLLSAWNKAHLMEILAEMEPMPSEYWYG